MKQKLIAAAALAACSAAVQAQSGNVTLYGLIDTTVRYSTNENAAGDRKTQVTDGAVTGNRWGLRGSEDMGGGLKTLVVLESGFAPDTGTSLQGGRLFGRQAFVGLDGDAGRILLGRQYTIANDALASFESFFLANNAIVGYQLAYTGLRYDNTVKYAKSVGPVTLNAGYTAGETAGGSSAKGVSATYASGPAYFGAFYQRTDNVTSGYFGAVPAAQASRQSVWGLGGSYQLEPVKLYLGYTNNKLDVANYKNDVLYAGFYATLTPALHLLGTAYYDKLKRPGADGIRLTSALMLDYYLSKRTDVYVEVDYTKLKDGWIALAANAAGATMFGRDKRAGVMLGLRHRF
jgi:predicted porin